MIVAVVLAMELVRQTGTGAMVPRAPRLENREQHIPKKGFAGTTKKGVSLTAILKMPCVSTACRLYCHPDNIVMRPGWCSYYGVPTDGYLTLKLEEQE